MCEITKENDSLQRQTENKDENSQKIQGNKNIPELRFPEFEEEWNKNTLNNLAKIQRGASPRPISSNRWYDNENKKVGWVRIGDVTNSSRYLYRTEDYFSEEGIKKSRFLPKGSLIMSICATIGKPIITEIDTCIHDGFVGFSDLTNINKEFLYYILKNLENKFISLSQTGSQANLNTNLINKTKINMPSIKEQEKIANFLTCIDQKIELMEKEINKQSKYMKKIREIILNDNSDNSNKVQLKEICIINKGKQLNKTNMINDGKYYVLNGGKTPSGFINSWNVPENTISISEGGNSCGFVNYNVQKFYCGGHCYYLTNISNEIDPLLLYHCLKMNENKIMNLRVGSGLPNIQKKDLEKYKLYIPTKNHEKITYLLNNINLKIDLNKEKLNHLKQFKKGLLQKMFC